MNDIYTDLENKATKDKKAMKTYYLEMQKQGGDVQIDKVTTDEEHRARRKAIQLMKENELIEEIIIVEVQSKKFITTITR